MYIDKIPQKMKDQLIEAIKNSFRKLKEINGSLFECPIEKNSYYDSRKLHEICINHKLANYLEKFIFPLLEGTGEQFFVDIEFNRESINFKEITINGQKEIVRPDIIIHNRKSENDKNNFLVVECKKYDNDTNKIAKDKNKLIAFLKDSRYKYRFALQVIYKPDAIEGLLFYLINGNVNDGEMINC